MDESYLDNLLNEISLDKEIDHNIEDELDYQIQEEKNKKQEESTLSEDAIFDMDLNQDAKLVMENEDLHFSEEQMDELDKLDNLADLDIGELDFSDIDFDDVDVTKLDAVEGNDFDDVLREFEGDFEIENYSENSDDIGSLSVKEDDEIVNKEDFDTNDFLDSLLEETDESEELPMVDLTEESLTSESNAESSDEDEEIDEITELSKKDNADLDDLFSMLNLDEDEHIDENADKNEELRREGLEDYQEKEAEDTIGILDNHKNSQKRSFMQILFGDPDEDDEFSEEEIAELEAKKAEKKAKKKALKEEKKAKVAQKKEEKALIDGKKKKEANEKKRLKAEIKAKKRAEEIATMEPEKKLNVPMVVFIFSLFLGGVFLFYLVSSNFNYTQVIERATNYFANQKYRKAYDEIAGVEVKEKDQDLKERIYTVMYVERLYESYNNNIKLNHQEKALDSLLRGVNKYYEHQADAKELGITSDLDYSFNQIQQALLNEYGISIEKAIEINALENYEYVEMIDFYVESKNKNDSQKKKVPKQDANLPKKKQATK